MRVCARYRGLEATPSADILEAYPDQRQESGDDEEELQYFVVDRAGEAAEKDVAKDNDGRDKHGKVENPADRHVHLDKERIENMQRLDKPGHGIHGDARGEDGHHGE